MTADYGGRWWLATLTQETLERLRAAKLDAPADLGGERRDMRGKRFKKQTVTNVTSTKVMNPQI